MIFQLFANLLQTFEPTMSSRSFPACSLIVPAPSSWVGSLDIPSSPMFSVFPDWHFNTGLPHPTWYISPRSSGQFCMFHCFILLHIGTNRLPAAASGGLGDYDHANPYDAQHEAPACPMNRCKCNTSIHLQPPNMMCYIWWYLCIFVPHVPLFKGTMMPHPRQSAFECPWGTQAVCVPVMVPQSALEFLYCLSVVSNQDK